MRIGEVSQQRSENTDLLRIYRPRAWVLSVVFAGVWTGGTLLMSWLILPRAAMRHNWLTPTLGIAFLMVVNIVYILVVNRVRIVISPNHFEYYGVGYRIRARWEDLVRVEHPRWPFWWRHKPINSDQLILRRSFIAGPGWIRAIIKFTGQSQIILIGHFDPWWRESALGDDIRFFAPQLEISKKI